VKMLTQSILEFVTGVIGAEIDFHIGSIAQLCELGHPQDVLDQTI